MNNSYRDLLAWQKAMLLAEEVYRIAATFPESERFGLATQLRRAAVSVPSNIAEGQGRLNTAEFRHFLGTARGSLLEVETQIMLAHRLGFLEESECGAALEHCAETGKLINGLIRSLRKPN